MADRQQPAQRNRARGRPRGWTDRREQNTIKSLDRAMEVFEHLSHDQGRTLTALAGELGEAPATVYRILVTLEGRGLVEFDAEAQSWSIGAGAFVIGARYLRRTSIAERARPILRALMEATGETANLGIRRGERVLFVAQAETHHSIRAFFPPGTLSPLHASGIGKALLAAMPEAQRRALVSASGLERFTPHTICTPDALEAELRHTHTQGYAVDGEERTPGMRCIAAAVFDASGEAVGGLSVSGPTVRIGTGDVPALARRVRAAASELSRALGADEDTSRGAGAADARAAGDGPDRDPPA